MLTLDRWRPFLNTPKTLDFPRLELIGFDHEPSIVVGRGQIEMVTPTIFKFALDGTPEDIGYVFAQLKQQRLNPYDPIIRFRLLGIDADGVEWAGGYTIPVVDTARNVWRFTGETNSLNTVDRSTTVSKQPGIELIFNLRIGDPLTLAVTGIPRRDALDTGYQSTREIEVLGSTIKLTYETDGGTFSVVASHSSDFPAHYAENWLSEPLRVMFGQLIYPRLVARNFGDGHANIRVGQTPALIPGARWAALCNQRQTDQIWELYAKILVLIALARGKNGEPNFESHKITRLYEEVIQASLGSRWVWALTFASSIEALAQMLVPKDVKPTEAESKAILALVDHIKVGPGEHRLKEAAVNAVRRTGNVTVIRILRELKRGGVIENRHLSSWEKIRNAVMHGSLISAYSSAEDDDRLLSLASMMHALTREVLRRATNQAGQAAY